MEDAAAVAGIGFSDHLSSVLRLVMSRYIAGCCSHKKSKVLLKGAPGLDLLVLRLTVGLITPPRS